MSALLLEPSKGFQRYEIFKIMFAFFLLQDLLKYLAKFYYVGSPLLWTSKASQISQEQANVCSPLSLYLLKTSQISDLKFVCLLSSFLDFEASKYQQWPKMCFSVPVSTQSLIHSLHVCSPLLWILISLKKLRGQPMFAFFSVPLSSKTPIEAMHVCASALDFKKLQNARSQAHICFSVPISPKITIDVTNDCASAIDFKRL